MMRSRKISGGHRSMCNLKNLSGGPLRANRCRELPRGIGAFLCMVLGPNSGLTICKTHPDKTLHPTPFFSTERYLWALGVRHAVAQYPVLLRLAPVLRYVLPVSRHGTPGRSERAEQRKSGENNTDNTVNAQASIPPVQKIMTPKSDPGNSKVLCTRVVLS